MADDLQSQILGGLALAVKMCIRDSYESVLDQSLTACQMDRETLETMLTAMKESLPAFRRYFKAKARALGHENGLPFYDLFAPMGADTRRFTLDEARAYLIQVLGAFSKKMADFVDRAFEERWIDPLPLSLIHI